MTDPDGDDGGRIDPERSPSCGYAKMPEVMGCPNANTVDAGELDDDEDDDTEVLEIAITMPRDTSTTLEVAL